MCELNRSIKLKEFISNKLHGSNPKLYVPNYEQSKLSVPQPIYFEGNQYAIYPIIQNKFLYLQPTTG